MSTTTDRERLEQVLNHLILNAIDFTSKGGKIEFGAQTKEKEIIFYVKDNGATLYFNILQVNKSWIIWFTLNNMCIYYFQSWE